MCVPLLLRLAEGGNAAAWGASGPNHWTGMFFKCGYDRGGRPGTAHGWMDGEEEGECVCYLVENDYENVSFLLLFCDDG